MSETDTHALIRQSAVLIGILAVLTYWPVLLGRVPLPADTVVQFPPWESVRPSTSSVPPHAEMGDLVTELYPWKALTKRTVDGGHFPLWNPHLFLGAPFQADPQTGLFDPVNLVYFVFSTPIAWSLSFLLRTVLAGVFAAMLAGALGASRRAAMMAGVVFAFCGWVTAFQARPHLDTFLWLPLALFATDLLARRPSRRAVALTAVSFALPVLGGQPESAAHVTLVGLIFFLYRLAWPAPGSQREPGARFRYFALFAAAGVLAVALASVQLVPTLQWLGLLNRGLETPWAPKPLHEIAAFLSRDLRLNPNSAGVAIPESAAYVGMLTLLLAPLAFFHDRRRDAVFFALLVATCLEIVYGRGPAYWLSLRIPVLNGIPNGRLLAVADLGLAMLAALGLTAAASRGAASRAFELGRWALSIAAVAACGIGVALVIQRNGKPFSFSPTGLRGPWGSAVFLLGAGVLLLLALSGRLEPSRFAVLAIAFCAVDLVSASYKFIPFARRAEIFPPAPTFRFLASQREPFRVASVNLTYGSSFEMMYGLDTPTGFNVILLRPRRLLGVFGFEDNAPHFDARAIAESDNRLLDLMNVKYLVATTWNDGAARLEARPDRFQLVFTDRSVRVFENLRVLPRAFLVPASGIRVLPRDEAELGAVEDPAFDPGTSVILPEAPVFPDSQRPPGGAPAPGVSAYTEGEDQSTLRADVTEPSILVVSQTHYPGWEALVDGARTPLLRADFAFVGVPIAPGTHDVRLVFRPAALLVGAAISLIGAAITLFLAFAGRLGRPLRAFSILVAVAALLTGFRAMRDRAWVFGAPPLRVFSDAFLGQVRAVESCVPPGAVLLFVEPPSDRWSFLLWRRALYPRNEVVLLETVAPSDLARLRSKYGIRYAIAAGDPPPDPGYLWSIPLGRTAHVAETSVGELRP
jgi:hypothetical protein